MDWVVAVTKLPTTVTQTKPVRLACVGLHEKYGICTQVDLERRTALENSQRCKKHQEWCSAS